MKRNVRLGINIDHVATLRNARGENYPEVTEAARIVEKSGADLMWASATTVRAAKVGFTG